MRRSKILFVILFCVFLIAGFIYLFLLFRKPIYIEGFKVLNKPFYFVEDNLYLDVDASNKIRLVILFTLEDCPICLFEARYWAQVAEEFKDKVAVVGITKPDLDIKNFINEYGIKFKILEDANLFEKICNLLRSQGFKCITPIKMFINSNNKVIAIEGGTKIEAEQRLFKERVNGFLETINKILKQNYEG